MHASDVRAFMAIILTGMMTWDIMQFQSFGEFSLADIKNMPSLIFLILTFLILNLVLMNLLIGLLISLPI